MPQHSEQTLNLGLAPTVIALHPGPSTFIRLYLDSRLHDATVVTVVFSHSFPQATKRPSRSSRCQNLQLPNLATSANTTELSGRSFAFDLDNLDFSTVCKWKRWDLPFGRACRSQNFCEPSVLSRPHLQHHIPLLLTKMEFTCWR